jgi:hypothetical protein
MGEVNPEEQLEIGRGVFKRLGDCTGSEIESAVALIAQKRIDRAWIAEQATRPDRGELTIGRRFFANTTEAERDLTPTGRWSSSSRKHTCATAKEARLDRRQGQRRRIEASGAQRRPRGQARQVDNAETTPLSVLCRCRILTSVGRKEEVSVSLGAAA